MWEAIYSFTYYYMQLQIKRLMSFSRLQDLKSSAHMLISLTSQRNPEKTVFFKCSCDLNNSPACKMCGQFIYLFIYYQFLSKTGVTQKAKPVQGASPQKLHTTYKLHIHTINNYKNETYTNKNLSYSELKNKKCFNVNLKCLAEVIKYQQGLSSR